MKREKSAPAAGERGSGIPHTIDVRVGMLLKARRQAIGMNQETLAAGVNLTFQQIQKYENGANRIGAARLAQFAGILGVDVEYFFIKGPIETRPEVIDLMRYHSAMTPALRVALIYITKTIAEEHHHAVKETPSRRRARGPTRRKALADAPEHAGPQPGKTRRTA